MIKIDGYLPSTTNIVTALVPMDQVLNEDL
jgi:hypothetical protein